MCNDSILATLLGRSQQLPFPRTLTLIHFCRNLLLKQNTSGALNGHGEEQEEKHSTFVMQQAGRINSAHCPDDAGATN